MLRIIALGVLLGVLALHKLSALPSAWWLLLILPLLAQLYLRFNRTILFANAAVMGFAWAYVHVAWQLQGPLPEADYGKDITVRGYIASLPERTARKQRFDFDVAEVLQPAGSFKPQRLRLSWYESADTQLHVGQEWQFSIRVKPARNFANPGMFNYSAWLFQKGIRYTGYVHASANAKLIGHSSFSYPLQQIRESIQRNLKQHLGGYPFEPFIRALVIGERSDISPSAWLTLQKTGTVHLMAISGLHIGLIAGCMFILMRLVWARFPRLCTWMAAPRAAALLAMLVALVYAALAGFSLPTQRALIMLSVIMLGVSTYRRMNPLDTLCIAMVSVLLFDPSAILSASFWLSFAAVALIFFMLRIHRHAPGRLGRWLKLQFAISLGLLPLTILFFQQAPLVSPLANLLAIPLVTLVIVPGAMLGVLLLSINADLAVKLFALLDTGFAWLWQGLEWLAQLPWSSLTIASPTLLGLLLAGTGTGLLLLPRSFAARHVALVMFIPLLWPLHVAPDTGEAYVTVLDVGQGLSAIVRTQQHTLVFDTGPKLGAQFDTGAAVVVPYLRAQGISKIDTLLISHGDNDHIGGTESILSFLPVHELITSVPERLSRHAPRRCDTSMHWVWDGVDIRVIYPQPGDYTAGLSENNLSCVLQVRTQHQTFLLTGDIETPAEQRLIARYAQKLRSHVLLVPHHGSKTSSSPDFIAAVQPDFAIFPVGWRNRYHFPNQAVLARYQQAGIRVFSTASSGAITIDSHTGAIDEFRAAVAQFWDS